MIDLVLDRWLVVKAKQSKEEWRGTGRPKMSIIGDDRGRRRLVTGCERYWFVRFARLLEELLPPRGSDDDFVCGSFASALLY